MAKGDITIPGRQGDILLIKVDKIPNRAEKKADNVIVRGESTGHAHRLQVGQLFEAHAEWNSYNRGGIDLFINATPGTRIVHTDDSGKKGDHDPIDVPPGKYIVRRQRQYADAHTNRVVGD